MRGTRSRGKRGRPPKANNNSNETKFLYSSKFNRTSPVNDNIDDEDEGSNESSLSANNTSKYQTRASRKPSYRIGITIERKRTRSSTSSKKRKGDDSEEDYYMDDDDEPILSDDGLNDEEAETDVDNDDNEIEVEDDLDDLEEDLEDDTNNNKKVLRPNREVAPLFFDNDSEIPELILPSSSEDLLIEGSELMQALSVYEILRHFQSTLRLTPFRFEDFCISLLIDEQTFLLSEIHIQLLKALIREDDLVGTQHGPQDLRDSINIYLYLCDHLTWPEVMRIYLSSDLKKNSEIIKNLLSASYPFSSIQNKLKLLEYLCEEFLNCQSLREVLNNEGIIKHEDNCRICYKPGDVICCDTCSAVFHLNCLDPPLKVVPNEEWNCPICKLNSINGVTDCMSEYEKSGYLSRQEPIGWDRHGRKYWFLSRRLIVEDNKSNNKVSYYSSRLQFDELLASLDEEIYEKDLCQVLNEMKEDIYRQMNITEKLTKTAKGSRKSYLEVINEELFIKQSAKLKLENGVDEKSVDGDNTIKDEKYAELEAKLAIDDDDLRAGGIGGGGVQTRLKTGSLQLKTTLIDPLKNRVNQYNVICSYREEDTVIMIQEGTKTLTRVPRKALPVDFYQTNLFKLGMEGHYRQYQNIYSNNPYALNKFQQSDDRDKKRQLSHKFSLTQLSELKWGTYNHINTPLPTTTIHGTKSLLINILRQALLYLELQITQTFMHPNWHIHRINWITAVGRSSEPKEFSLALAILESSMKPVLFNSTWHDNLGFTILQRSTQLERDELKKKDKKEKRDLNDTSAVSIGIDSEANSRFYGAGGSGIKLVFGKLKHQIWKQKGEEYRLSGVGGWNWFSSTRLKYNFKKKPISKMEIDLSSTAGELIDISHSFQNNDLPRQKFDDNLYDTSTLDSLLKKRTEMFDFQRKHSQSNSTTQKKEFSLKQLKCYSASCDSSSTCYSSLCCSITCDKTKESEEMDYGSTLEHVDLHEVRTRNGVKELEKRTIPFNSRRHLPQSNRFSSGNFRSIFILTPPEMRRLGRLGGLREVQGFSYNCKINNSVWPYGMTPRPVFRMMWLLRTNYMNNIHSVALQLRVFWASIRWDDLAMKPPVSGTNTITTENEVQTIEILKRRDLPPTGLRSEYLIRKIIVPIDLPVRQREVSTPNRSGLRERRRPDSPQVKGPRMNEIWVNEEDLELWEIRQFAEKAEKQLLAAKQRAAQDEKQRQLELRKKNEEQRKLDTPNKLVNGFMNPAKAINSRMTQILHNQSPSTQKLIHTPLSVNAITNSPNITAFATIRTSNGTYKIPVQNKQAVQQLILRPNNQIITTVPAGSTQSTINIGSSPTIINRPGGGTATYIVRSPGMATNRPIIISNSSLNGPIVRPINNIQTNFKQSIPLISTTTGQKINTSTVNAILTSTTAKNIPISQVVTSTTTSTTNQQLQTSTATPPKNFQCVQVKLNDGRTTLLPLTSLAGGQNSNFQITVAPNANNQQLRILKSVSSDKNSPIKTDGAATTIQNKPILVPATSIISTNNGYILSNMNNTKVLLQQVPMTTSSTSTISTPLSNNQIVSIVSKPTVIEQPKVIIESVKKPIDNNNKLPPSKVANEEKEFVLTHEMTQEIIRKALMDSNLQPDVSQKLMAYQRHHQEQLDYSSPFVNHSRSPIKEQYNQHSNHTSTPISSLSNSRSSRTQRFTRGKYDSSEYIMDPPKLERSTDRNSYRSDEDEVTRSCRTLVRFLVDKIEKEEKRAKHREKLEEQRLKRIALQKQRYRQNHIEMLRRSIIRRKSKFNNSIKKIVEDDIRKKLNKRTVNKVAVTQVNEAQTTNKRKFVEEETSKAKSESPINSTTQAERSKSKRLRLSQSNAMNNKSNETSHGRGSHRKSNISPKGNKSEPSDKEIYCFCMKPYDKRLMVGCDYCPNWYHPLCVNMVDDVSKIDENICPQCDPSKSKSFNQTSTFKGKTPSIIVDDKRKVTIINKGANRRTSTPSTSRTVPSKRTKSEDIQMDNNNDESNKSLYCICRKPYDNAQFYIYCDQCEDWFHGRCVGITSAEADNIADYTCPKCEGDNSTTIKNIKDLNEADYISLSQLLKSIQMHKSAWPFLKPVDKRQVPDYYVIIKEPVDLKKIETRLHGRTYKKLAEFIYDMQKMFDNCRVYNAQQSQYYQCAETLEGFFVSKIRLFRENSKNNH
ncbi:hypothetical protein RDWZM_006697 [Blomia tropicalis]|uniref:Uncharacterized protein n=1 Tax=Blomia tropicalis TaxID=40697 RepID=A0A9Q0RNU5_BLOTA|nr:hypothetical protein RDWZM_006697 [Blomia tropicalis]